MNQKFSAHLAIFNNKNQILLVKRRDLPIWVIPGGRYEKGENPLDTALREFEEETGCSVTRSKIKLVAEYFPKEQDGFFKYLFVKFLSSPLNLKITEETSGFGFFNIKRLPYITSQYERKKIMDAFISLNKKDFFIKRLDNVDYFAELIELIKNPIRLIKLILIRSDI